MDTCAGRRPSERPVPGRGCRRDFGDCDSCFAPRPRDPGTAHGEHCAHARRRLRRSRQLRVAPGTCPGAVGAGGGVRRPRARGGGRRGVGHDVRHAGRRSLAGLLARTTMRTKPAIAATEDTEPLVGGNMSRAVTRVGDTVRKPHLPQSDTVQRLVAHVRAQGVTWAAEPLGVDDAGMDVWRYIPGDVAHDGSRRGLPRRRGHRRCRVACANGTTPRSRSRAAPPTSGGGRASSPPRSSATWTSPPTTTCSATATSLAPSTLTSAIPGPRLWDLAYTAYRYVPLTPDADDDHARPSP